MTTQISKDKVNRLHNAADDAYLAWRNAPAGKKVELWQQYEDAAAAYWRALREDERRKEKR